jgi:molybdopterin-guanine dinucleotide biosynthesis protein A
MLEAVNGPSEEPVGVVLAGGLGRRIGGDKAVVELAGRPLISYPVTALRAVLGDVKVLVKPGTTLPGLAGVEIWTEPAEPHHPLVGILHALRSAAPRPVLICAADMPFLTAEAVRELAGADPGGAPAVVAARARGLEPMLGCYRPQAADLLEPAALEARQPLRAAVAAIGPRLLDLDPELLFNVNTPADLARAEQMLNQR